MQQQFSKWQEFGSYIYEVTTIMTTLLLKRNLQSVLSASSIQFFLH